ncbi:unnamed protein product [Trichobilharzia szidati]|nr:unnamed protein product [Trichobilharzia szidati]
MLLVKPGDYLSSPISLLLLLATLLGSGATKGNTKVQLAEALEIYDGRDEEKIGKKMFTLLYENLTKEKADGENIISIGNGIFVRKEAPIKKSFMTRLKSEFFSDVVNVDFTKPKQAVKNINDWVCNKTHKLIPEFLKQPLSRQTLLALISTLHFKGKWKMPFSKLSTTEKYFKPARQSVIKVPMMHITETMGFGTFTQHEVHIVSKEFSNPRFTFIVVLPAKPGKIEDTDKILSGEVKLSKLMNELRPTRVALSLPRFKLDSTINLVSTLDIIGVTDLFAANRADLTGMTNRKIHADIFQQSTSLKVKEEGVEAAAATVVGFKSRSKPLPPKIAFIANESFLCFIYDKVLKTNLFAGRVIKPVSILDDK